MKRSYREYSNEDIITYAAQVYSIAGLLKKLGLRVCGGNYINIKRKLQELDVDCSHWTGKAWCKNQRLKDWSKYTRANSIKIHIINERGHKCESCNHIQWLNKPIPLEIHHLDGDRTNNNYTNLQLICCNCHAQTKNWRNKKR